MPDGVGVEQDWDALDRVSAVRPHAGLADPRRFESEYAYDASGNLERVTDPFGRETTYAYDAADRLTTVTRPNGVTTTCGYDARDRTTSVVHADATGAVIASVAYVRSASGEPTRITREDGSYVELGYDGSLRLTSERYHDATGTVVEEIGYGYDRDGNRTTRTTSAGEETYVCASGSRLTEVRRAGVTEQTFDYDGGGRVTGIERDGAELSLTYDADDHVVELVDASGDGARFEFDAEGRSVSRRPVTAGVSGALMRWATAATLVASLASPQLATAADGTAETGYVFDGEHATALYDANSGEATYYLRDAMGSVIAMVGPDGVERGTIHYDGFGNVRRESGGITALPEEGGPRFHGMWAERSGLYYVRAREYDPRTGRFLSRDPAPVNRRLAESALPYALAANSPPTGRDPTGRYALSEALASVQITLMHAAQAAVQTAVFVCSAQLAASALTGAATDFTPEPAGPCRSQTGPRYQTIGRDDASRARALFELGFVDIPVFVLSGGGFRFVRHEDVFSVWLDVDPQAYGEVLGHPMAETSSSKPTSSWF